MALIDRIKEQAKTQKTRIVFPEGIEPRIVRGVDIIQQQGIADCVILGVEENIRALAPECKLEGVTFIDPATSDKTAEYAEVFYELRKKKGVTPEAAQQTLRNHDVLRHDDGPYGRCGRYGCRCDLLNCRHIETGTADHQDSPRNLFCFQLLYHGD